MKIAHLRLEFNRECKHSIRYDAPEEDKTAHVKSVYVSKKAFEGDKWPTVVILAVESVD